MSRILQVYIDDETERRLEKAEKDLDFCYSEASRSIFECLICSVFRGRKNRIL